MSSLSAIVVGGTCQGWKGKDGWKDFGWHRRAIQGREINTLQMCGGINKNSPHMCMSFIVSSLMIGLFGKD